MNIYANLPDPADAINNIAENTHASGRELLSLCQLAGIPDDHFHHIMSQWAENDGYGAVLEQMVSCTSSTLTLTTRLTGPR